MHQLRSIIVVAFVLALPACTESGSPDGGTKTPVVASTPPAAPTTAPSSNGRARIAFAKTTHDFGVIGDAQDYYTTFSFTNTGTGTLVISEVKATCGCTVPTLAKTAYAPGESATLNVTFDPSGKAGLQSKFISVISNAQKQSVTKLAIRADVRPLVDYNFFLRFGEIELGQQHTRRVELRYSDPDLEITDLFVTNPHFSVKLIDVGTPNPATRTLPYRATLEVTAGSDVPWGLIYQTQVKFTARGRAAEHFAPAASPYTVMVTGQVFGDVRLDPVMLASRETMARSQQFKVSAKLSRASGAPFSVSDIKISETTASGLNPYVVTNGPNSHTVYLEGTTPVSGGPVAGVLVVTTDAPGEESLPIRFALFVK